MVSRKNRFNLLAACSCLALSMASAPVALAGDVAAGKAAYQQYCQACHQPGGAGIPNVFPPLANNNNINNKPAYLAEAIIKGVSGPLEVNGRRYNGTMPPMPYMSNKQVADVVAYIQSALNDGKGNVSEDDVESMR